MLVPVLFTLLGISFVKAQFGATCAGGTVPDVAALESQYPTIGDVADILPGDTLAQQLFGAISGSALSAPPNTQDAAGDVNMNGYDANNDPMCWWSATNCVQSKRPGIPPDAHICPSPATWGLSFDDGPTCAHGPLYQLLKQNNQQATLFYIGGNVASYPEEARLGFANGHEICVHTWSHHYMTTLTNSQIFAELYYTKKIIKQLLGVTPRCWRPPYGDIDDRVRTIATALELGAFIWSADTNDWMAAETGLAQPNADYSQILAGNYGTTGTMVLTHELDDLTVNLFLQHWQNIRNVFKNVVSAGSCMNITNPYAETAAPLTMNMAQFLAKGAVLANQVAPNAMNSTALPLFGGQAAFLASLNGTTLLPPVSSSSALPSSTMTMSRRISTTAIPSTTAAVVPSSSRGAQMSSTAIIATAVGAAAGAAVLLALVVLCIRRHRSEAARLAQIERYNMIGSPSLLYEPYEHENKSRSSSSGFLRGSGDEDAGSSVYGLSSRYASQASLTALPLSARTHAPAGPSPPLMAGEWAPPPSREPRAM